MLFASSLLLGNRFLDHQIGVFSHEQQVSVAGVPILPFVRMQMHVSRFPRLLDGGFDLQQQRFHFTGPVLLVGLFNEGQFAQMMDIAQGMGTAILLIGLPPIMDAGPLKTR